MSLMRSLGGLIIVLSVLSSKGIAATKTVKQQGPSQQEFYSTADKTISAEDRRKANQLRIQTIDSIKSLLAQKNVKGSRRFELLLRLGELYTESHDYLRDDELADFEKENQAWVEKGKKGKAPTLSDKRSKTQMASAATVFRQLVKEFPNNPRTAPALYSLGKTLARLGDDGAINYFQQLIKNHKSSPLVADAYLSMGEFYFEKNDIEKATDSYKKYMKYKDHPAYPYGVYKLGWTFYNATPKNQNDAAENLDKAVTSFKLAIKLSDKNLKGRKYRINLKEEALKDLIMVWSETENIDAAWAYFKTIDEKKSFYDLLERLGSVYASKGRNSQATTVYTRLLSDAPTRPSNPKIYEALLQIHDASGRLNKVVEALDEMDKLYVKNSAWTRQYSKEPATLADARNLVEFAMHRYGTMYHERGQKTKNKDFLAAASQIYNMHLTAFPDSKNAYEIRYYFADILLDFKKYESSAEQYLKVVDANPKGKYLNDAAINAVVALNKLDQETKYAKLPPAGQVPKPIAFPKVKKKLIDALDKYIAVLPDSKDGYPMRFTVAQTYFDYGFYPEAIQRFEKITQELPGTKQADSSVKLLLAFQSERKDWEKTILVSRKYLSQKSLKKDLREYIVNVMRNAMYNIAVDLEKTQKFEDAGRAFLAFQKEFAWDKSAGDKALINAASNFYKAGLLEDALAANTKLTESYPDSPLTPNAIINIGQTYEALAQYDKAARFYDQFATRYPKNELASKALYNAATLYRGLNRNSEAEKLYTRFVQYYPRNTLANDVRMEVAKLQEKQEQFKAAIASYKTIFETSAIAEEAAYGGAKAAVLSLKHDNEKEGYKLFAAVRAKLRAKDSPEAFEARRLVAELMFNDLESSVAAFKQIKINNARTIEGDVKKKQARLEQLAKRFEEVMSVESPEFSVASLYRLGELHEDFAENLFNAPTPEGANQVEISQFKSSIEKVAFPLRDEAYKFYETAFKRSQEVETFTVWTRKTYDKMAELSPDKNPEVLEQETEPTYMANRVSVEPAVSALAH